jgi:hypothetical protein
MHREMNNHELNKITKIFRVLGCFLGMLFLAGGIALLFIQPVYDTLLEKINGATFVVLGICFLIYGVTGYSAWDRKRS